MKNIYEVLVVLCIHLGEYHFIIYYLLTDINLTKPMITFIEIGNVEVSYYADCLRPNKLSSHTSWAIIQSIMVTVCALTRFMFVVESVTGPVL